MKKHKLVLFNLIIILSSSYCYSQSGSPQQAEPQLPIPTKSATKVASSNLNTESKYEDNCKYPNPMPSEITESIRVSNQLYLEGKFKECAYNYNRLVSNYPDYCVGYYNRGLARYFSGDTIGAKEDFDKAISLGLLEAKVLLLKYYEK